MHSSIFSGQVSHHRKTPLENSFRYRVFMMYLDLSELDEVFKGRWLWSTKRPALARFERCNYLGDADRPLDQAVRDLVAKRTGSRPTGAIRLLTHLSYFGYCFNPLSVYYCFDEDERLDAIVAEVSNTPWGDRHCYVLSREMNTDRTWRLRVGKAMHVSPFMGMDMDYDWLLTEPSDDLVVRINNKQGDRHLFNATLILKRSEITARALAGVLLRYPFMTARVILGIHWQALKLWLKGCPVYDHPAKNPRQVQP